MLIPSLLVSYELSLWSSFLNLVIALFWCIWESSTQTPLTQVQQYFFMVAGSTAASCGFGKWCFQCCTSSVCCTSFVMQPCRCLQECNVGGCLHYDHHRLWLGRCAVCCPSSKILCQSQHGLPETATGVWKAWCRSGKRPTNRWNENQSSDLIHELFLTSWSDSLVLVCGSGLLVKPAALERYRWSWR